MTTALVAVLVVVVVVFSLGIAVSMGRGVRHWRRESRRLSARAHRRAAELHDELAKRGIPIPEDGEEARRERAGAVQLVPHAERRGETTIEALARADGRARHDRPA